MWRRRRYTKQSGNWDLVQLGCGTGAVTPHTTHHSSSFATLWWLPCFRPRGWRASATVGGWQRHNEPTQLSGRRGTVVSQHPKRSVQMLEPRGSDGGFAPRHVLGRHFVFLLLPRWPSSPRPAIVEGLAPPRSQASSTDLRGTYLCGSFNPCTSTSSPLPRVFFILLRCMYQKSTLFRLTPP